MNDQRQTTKGRQVYRVAPGMGVVTPEAPKGQWEKFCRGLSKFLWAPVIPNAPKHQCCPVCNRGCKRVSKDYGFAYYICPIHGGWQIRTNRVYRPKYTPWPVYVWIKIRQLWDKIPWVRAAIKRKIRARIMAEGVKNVPVV